MNAVEYATKIGTVFESSLELLHIITEKEFEETLGTESPSESYNQMLTETEERLKAFVTEIGSYPGNHKLTGCNSLIRSDEVQKGILSTAEEGKHQLIVMGTRGMSKYKTLFVGSNTVHVIEKAKCPVLCVPEDATYNGFKTIVYATDYLQEDKIMIQSVVSFAMPFDSLIKILHVSHRDQILDKAMYEEFKSELPSFIQYSKIEFDRKVYSNSVESGLDEFMREQKADLLVLITKRRNFFQKLFHKSLTRKMSYFTDYPLLVFNI